MTPLMTAKDSRDAQKLSRLARQGKLRRIYHGIYTTDLKKPLPEYIQENWLHIIPLIVKQGLLSHSTAILLKPVPYQNQKMVFVTSAYSKTIQLPGLIIKVLRGNYHDYTEPVTPLLMRSNTVRSLLENLTTIKDSAYKKIKTIGTEGVEIELAKILKLRKEKELNRLRDEAKMIAKQLGTMPEYEKLNAIISSLLATHSTPETLQTSYAQAFAKNEPYDATRINILENLYLYLKRCQFKERTYQYTKQSFINLSFFESYFSNYIEGTRFLIDEAENIIFNKIEINHRHADSHEVFASFKLTSDYSEMSNTIASSTELLHTLRTRHAVLMAARPDKRPGEFKQYRNLPGNTYFVEPEEVVGTLKKAFEYYVLLQPGLAKALYIHFMIAEIHPFDDGNGRLARIMMNAECVAANIYKIIIPTVHRENYIDSLRLTSRDHIFRTYCKAIDQAHAYTASIPWTDYGEARENIENDKAQCEPEEGLANFNRALRQLELSEFADER